MSMSEEKLSSRPPSLPMARTTSGMLPPSSGTDPKRSRCLLPAKSVAAFKAFAARSERAARVSFSGQFETRSRHSMLNRAWLRMTLIRLLNASLSRAFPSIAAKRSCIACASWGRSSWPDAQHSHNHGQCLMATLPANSLQETRRAMAPVSPPAATNIGSASG